MIILLDTVLHLIIEFFESIEHEELASGIRRHTEVSKFSAISVIHDRNIIALGSI